MNAFGQVMTPQQLDDVTAYVRSLASAPATGMLPEPTGKEPIVINPKGKDPTWTPREGKFIGVDDVAKALKEKKRLIILDARPPSDWRRVHIEGAVSMPHYDPKRIDEVLAQKNVYAITYCACPHHLSGLLQEELAKKGYTRALILDEGINVWHQKGYPVTAAEGVQPPPLEPQGGSGGSGR
jgi:rhodanese-related sulfurtransferase